MQQKILMKKVDPRDETKFLDEWFTVYLNSRAELQSDFIQSQLSIRNLKQRTIKCGCRAGEELYLSSNKSTNNQNKTHYFIKRYTREREHHVECMFNSEVKEYIHYSEDGKATYKPSIFDEPNVNMYDNEIRPAVESDMKRYTYYSYCQDLISSACTYAFYYKNMNNSRGNLQNFTYIDFISSFKQAIKKTPVMGVNNLHEYCLSDDNGFRYSYGIIEDEIIGYLSAAEDLEDNAIVEIPLSNGKTLKTTKKRLQIAAQRLRIFNHYIHPQYFFIAVSNYGVAVRLYLYPIYYDQENICFVESDYERRYAEQLYTNNITFIKPINNLEVQYIKKEQICPPGQSKFRLTSRPDFIEFGEKFNITIVEVSGYEHQEYIEQLEDKERDYHKMIENYPYLEYKRVNGNALNK